MSAKTLNPPRNGGQQETGPLRIAFVGDSDTGLPDLPAFMGKRRLVLKRDNAGGAHLVVGKSREHMATLIPTITNPQDFHFAFFGRNERAVNIHGHECHEISVSEYPGSLQDLTIELGLTN